MTTVTIKIKALKNVKSAQGQRWESNPRNTEAVQWDPLFAHPQVKHDCYDDFLPTSLLNFSRRQKYKYFPVAYRTQDLCKAKQALKYYSLYTKGAV